MIDYGAAHRQRLIRPRLLDVLREFFTQPPDIDWHDDHLCGIDPLRDPLADLKRARAIHKLGRLWRGSAACTHTYTNSLGVRTDPGALTETTR